MKCKVYLKTSRRTLHTPRYQVKYRRGLDLEASHLVTHAPKIPIPILADPKSSRFQPPPERYMCMHMHMCMCMCNM